MRISTDMIADNSLYDIGAAAERMTRVQNQLSSGKQLNQPSDDPAGTSQALGMRSALAAIEQYQQNIQDARAFTGTSDSALSHAADLIRQARSLAMQGASDALDENARQALAEQVNAIVDELGVIGNTKYGDRYVFAGQRTNAAPFEANGDGYTYKGGAAATGDGRLTAEIAPGDYVQINATGDRVLGGVFDKLNTLAGHLATGQVSQISNDDLAALDDALNTVNSARAEFGANVQRLDLTKSHLDDTSAIVSSVLSKVVDADIPSTVVELNNAQNAYQAALASTARGFQQSLLDFLR